MEYNDILNKIRRREIEHLLILGDRAIDKKDLDAALIDGLKAAKVSVGVLSDSTSPLADAVSFVVPGRTILEKSGLMLNRMMRLQYTQNVVPLRDGTVPEWRFLAQLAEATGTKLLSGDSQTMSDRDLTRWYLSSDTVMAPQGITIQSVKAGGVQLSATTKGQVDGSASPGSQEASAGA
jgi:predicted molibdopterin-dependent oxidoreductase YjgC